MFDTERATGFQWDRGNIDKNYKKHGITPNETEEIFLDEALISFDDIGHSGKEHRHVALGQTREKKILFVVFTIRNFYIRVISARLANKKEKQIYEKQT